MINHRNDSIKEHNQAEKEEADLKAVASISFVVMAESEMIDDTTAAEHPTMFLPWTEHFTTPDRGKIVREEVKGEWLLFKNIHPILDPSQNRRPSEDTTMQLWKPVGNPGDEWPEWSQPIAGVDTPYAKGDKVTHKGGHWISDLDNNVWEPGAYGWTQAE